jgi:hypothetical protein
MARLGELPSFTAVNYDVADFVEEHLARRHPDDADAADPDLSARHPHLSRLTSAYSGPALRIAEQTAGNMLCHPDYARCQETPEVVIAVFFAAADAIATIQNGNILESEEVEEGLVPCDVIVTAKAADGAVTTTNEAGAAGPQATSSTTTQLERERRALLKTMAAAQSTVNVVKEPVICGDYFSGGECKRADCRFVHVRE